MPNLPADKMGMPNRESGVGTEFKATGMMMTGWKTIFVCPSKKHRCKNVKRECVQISIAKSERAKIPDIFTRNRTVIKPKDELVFAESAWLQDA